MPLNYINFEHLQLSPSSFSTMRPSHDSVSTTTHIDMEQSRILEVPSSSSTSSSSMLNQYHHHHQHQQQQQQIHHQPLPSIINLGNSNINRSNSITSTPSPQPVTNNSSSNNLTSLPQSPPISFQNIVVNEISFNNPTTTEQQLTSPGHRFLINNRRNHNDIAAIATQHPNLFRSQQIQKEMLPPIGSGSGLELSEMQQSSTSTSSASSSSLSQTHLNSTSSSSSHQKNHDLKILQNDMIKPANNHQVLQITSIENLGADSKNKALTSQINDNCQSVFNGGETDHQLKKNTSSFEDNILGLNDSASCFSYPYILDNEMIDADTDTADLAATIAENGGNGDCGKGLLENSASTSSSRNYHSLQNMRTDSISSMDSSLDLEKSDHDKEGEFGF